VKKVWFLFSVVYVYFRDLWCFCTIVIFPHILRLPAVPSETTNRRFYCIANMFTSFKQTLCTVYDVLIPAFLNRQDNTVS